mgnify:CR=1 FL=1|jgi:hypothetical protein
MESKSKSKVCEVEIEVKAEVKDEVKAEVKAEVEVKVEVDVKFKVEGCSWWDASEADCIPLPSRHVISLTRPSILSSVRPVSTERDC